MPHVGFICDVKDGVNPINSFGTAWLCRSVPMSKVLEQFGTDLFIYSRLQVDPKTKTASGYYIQDNKFVPATAPVPKENGNWYFGIYNAPNISGMNNNEFTRWAIENEINIYPPHEFANLVSDKFLTHEVISKFSKQVHPYTEKFSSLSKQINEFLSQSESVFLKPRWGGHGDKILVLRKVKRKYYLAYYRNKMSETYCFTKRGDIEKVIFDVVGKKSYIIQTGIDVAKYEGAPFIIRVIMLHDGKVWHWTHKLVVAPSSGDIANTDQGGLNYTLDYALPKLYSKEAANKVLKSLHKVSFGLSDYLDSLYPNKLMEVAYDFILDKANNVHLAEVNTQPGLAKPGMKYPCPFNNIFDISEDEKKIYNNYIVPHATYLAKFLQSKL